MVRRHVELTLVITPRVARSVRVHLDAESVRIGEVHRFAHEVVRHPGVDAGLGEMRHEASERSAIRKQDRKVIQAQQSAARNRSRARQPAKMNDLAILSVRAETRRIGVAVEDAHAEDVLVEKNRSIEIGNLKPNPTEMCRFREAVAFGANSRLLVSCSRHLRLCHLLRLRQRVPHPASRVPPSAANAKPP